MPRALSLSDIPAEEFTEFNKKVKAANGRIIVLVHPFFEEVEDHKYYDTVYDLLKQSKTPVLVLEEGRKVSGTREKLEKLRAPKHLILPTGQGRPLILLQGHHGEVKKEDEKTESERAEKLVKVLEEAGARTILIGGMKSIFTRTSAVEGYERRHVPVRRRKGRMAVSYGCVGHTYARLIRSRKLSGVKIRLIPFAMRPHRPNFKARYFRKKTARKPASGKPKKKRGRTKRA